MAEETKTEEKPVDKLQEAKDAAAALKVENDRKEALLTLEVELTAKRLQGGQAEAGQPAPKEEKKEETPVEYKDRMMKEGYPHAPTAVD